jgi:hypothetical protein
MAFAVDDRTERRGAHVEKLAVRLNNIFAIAQCAVVWKGACDRLCGSNLNRAQNPAVVYNVAVTKSKLSRLSRSHGDLPAPSFAKVDYDDCGVPIATICPMVDGRIVCLHNGKPEFAVALVDQVRRETSTMSHDEMVLEICKLRTNSMMPQGVTGK